MVLGQSGVIDISTLLPSSAPSSGTQTSGSRSLTEGIHQQYLQLIQPLQSQLADHSTGARLPSSLPKPALATPKLLDSQQFIVTAGNQPQPTVPQATPETISVEQATLEENSVKQPVSEGFLSLLSETDEDENPQAAAVGTTANTTAPNTSTGVEKVHKGGFLDLLGDIDDDDDDMQPLQAPTEPWPAATQTGQLGTIPTAIVAQLPIQQQAALYATDSRQVQAGQPQHRTADGSGVYILGADGQPVSNQHLEPVLQNVAQGAQQGTFSYTIPSGEVYDAGVVVIPQNRASDNSKVHARAPSKQVTQLNFQPPQGYEIAAWSEENGVPTVTLVAKSTTADVTIPTAKRQRVRGTGPRGGVVRNAHDQYLKKWEQRQPRDKEATWCSNVCAVCEQADARLIVCMGPCLRAFHAECIGLSSPPPEHERPHWFCPECDTGMVRCHSCGGRASGMNDPEFTKCILPICGRFYHKRCLDAHPYAQKRDSTDSYRCPQHYCNNCTRGGEGRDMVKCVRCPVAYHAACLPRGARRLVPRGKAILCAAHPPEEVPPDYEHPTLGRIPNSRLEKLRSLNGSHLSFHRHMAVPTAHVPIPATHVSLPPPQHPLPPSPANAQATGGHAQPSPSQHIAAMSAAWADTRGGELVKKVQEQAKIITEGIAMSDGVGGSRLTAVGGGGEGFQG